ncbi:MAG: O-antigen ligase family protein [Deltaproteobacteria bacterium]|nr:O-antigen ligase family protein [Deltaproteobacteria bacterium]
MTGRDRLSIASVALAVGASILLVGGATRWAQAIIAIVAAGSLLVSLGSRRGLEPRSPLLIMIGFAAAWTTVQLLPMPGMIVEALSPTLQGLRAEGTELAGVPARSTLSMDPAATLRALTFLLTLTGVAVVASRVAVSDRGRYYLIAAVAGFCGVAAVLVGLHELFGAERLYGLYELRQASPTVMGPLLNANHLGCLMALGSVLCAGLVFYTKQTTMARAIWVAVGAACLAVTFATLSRGAVLALIAGTFVVLGALVAQRIQAAQDTTRKRHEKLIGRTLPVGVVAVCGLVVAVYIGAGSVMQQLEDTSLQEIKEPRSKFAAWRSSARLIEESPWVGVGRGAFESAFTRVHPASAFVTFSHPENEPLQAIVEWGVPVALILGGLAAWLVLRSLRRWENGALAAGALGAVMVVAFQSNFDFGMELLGLAVPVTVVLATLSYVPLREFSPKRVRSVQALRIAHAAAILAGAVVLVLPITRSIDEDHRQLRSNPSATQIARSIEQHPLDYYGYAVLAERLLKQREPGAVRALNHALQLHPTHPGLHRIAARLLLRAKPPRLDQAESEYHAAIQGTAQPRELIAEVVTMLPRDSAARAIPLEMSIDVAVRALRAEQRLDVAIAWLERRLARKPDLHTSEVLYELAMDAQLLPAAETAARRRCELAPSIQCRLSLARVLTKAAKPAEVIATLQNVAEWRGYRKDQLEAWLMLCDAHAARAANIEARQCLRSIEGSGLVRPGDSQITKRLEALPPPVTVPGSRTLDL